MDLHEWAEVLGGLLAAGVLAALKVILGRTKSIHDETKRNGGKSLRDAVDKTGRRVGRLVRGQFRIREEVAEVAAESREVAALQWLIEEAPPEVQRSGRYALFVKDGDGRNVRTSRRYRQFFGIEGLGEDWRQVVDQKREPRYLDEMMAAFRDGGPDELNRHGVYLFVVGADGERRSTACNVHCKLIRRDNGRLVRCVGIVYETTSGVRPALKEG